MAKTINLGKVGLTFEGDYDSSKNYASRTCVFYNHVSWASKKDVPAGIAPGSNYEYWQKVSDRGAQGATGAPGQSYVDKELVPIVDNLTTGGSSNVLSAEQGKVLKAGINELESKVAYAQGITIPIYDSAEHEQTLFGFDIKAGSVLSEINISSDIGIYLRPSSGADPFFVQKIELPYTLLEDIKGFRTRKAVDNGNLVFSGVIHNIQEEISNLESQISTLETDISDIDKSVQTISQELDSSNNTLDDLKTKVTSVTKIVTESGTEQTIKVDDIDWVNGITNSVTGKYDSSNTSYLTILSPIEVQENDVVKMYRSDNGVLNYAGDVIFFRQGALISSLSNPTFPVTVPENIDGVVINRTSLNDIGAYITLTRTETTLEPKMASEDDYGFMSKEDKQKLNGLDVSGASGLEELKADVATIGSFVAKESSVEESIKVDDIDWVIGVTNSVTGKYNSANTTYITTENPIAVNPADKLDFFRSDGGHIGVAGDIVFFSNNTYHSASETSTFPVIIPDGINGVKVNIFKEYLEQGAYAKITRSSKSYTPKLATSTESGLMSANDKSKLDNIDRVAMPELATPTDSGLMSANDKQKLDSIVLPIPTPVIEGSGMYKNASAYGVLPNNDGNTNADNYQAAVSGGGTIVIDIPGTYEFSKTIKIPSNTTLLFGANVYIKRVAGTNGRVVGGYSFINENAYTGIYDSNIKIIGLNLIANGQDYGTTIQGLRSMLAFMHIKNLVIDGFQMRDGADEGKLIQNNYGIQIVDFQNISLTNIYIESYKDGIHLGIGKDFTIRDCKFRTHDDPIAINAMDYVASNAALGTIENGIIDNVHDLDFSGETECRGRSILIYTGSWSDWKAGESYQYGDTVVSNGKIYRATSPARGAEAIVAVNQPTHDSGSVTTAEGIEWLMYQDFKVGYRADVKNVTISNLFVSQKRVAILSCDAGNGSWNRATLSDEISSIDNIILDKVYDLNGSDYAVMIYQDAELFRVSNSYFKNAGIQVNGFKDKTYKPAVVSLVNNYFGSHVHVVLNYSSSRVVKAKTSNTIVNGTLYFNDNVEVLDNQ